MDTPVAEGLLLGARYRLGPALGRGGMADVYDAYDERLARSVAVKLLRPELAASPELRRRFEAEARAPARLSHPNVVAVYDTGSDHGRAFIVMERLPGDTLADRIASGPVDAAWLRRVAIEVLAALSAAHAAGIVHRDIKPGNVLLAADGRAKVADFGIAKTMEPLASAGRGGFDLTATGLIVGTPAYLAPERVDGRPATPQSDLYAVGVVLYEALTGRKPFSGDTPIAVAYSIRHQPPPDPRHFRPDADPRMVAVLGQAMAPDPALRFASASAMARALGPAGPAANGGRRPDATAVLTAPPSAVPRPAPPGPPRHRRRGWVALLSGLAVIAAAVLVAGLVARNQGAPVPTATTNPPTTGPSSGASPNTSATAGSTTPPGPAPTNLPAVPLSTRLTDLANSLTTADGSAVPDLQSGLRAVAALPAGSGPQADAATRLLARATRWYTHGQLSAAAYGPAVNLLQQAGGVLPSDAPSITPPSGTPTSTGRGHRGGGGNG